MLERRDIAWWRRAIRGSTSILVLDVGGTIAGYATLGLNRARSLPQEGEIYELYLRPEYQGVGLGKRLFTGSADSCWLRLAARASSRLVS
jgi:ribosomal protein S18 acetylase RimI-like enzyme